MDGLVHRPVPGLPAGWLRLLSIAGLSDPSITTYTSSTTVQGPILTVYEMASSIDKELAEARADRKLI